MAAGIQDMYIEQGATYSAVLFFQDSLMAPIDLTGSTFRGQIKRTATTVEAVSTFRFTILNQTTDTGKVKIYIPATDTAAIPVKFESTITLSVNKYVYDIVRTLPDLTVQRVLQGIVNVSPEVSK